MQEGTGGMKDLKADVLGEVVSLIHPPRLVTIYEAKGVRDTIIEAVTQALLSDDAIEAGAKVRYTSDGNPGPWDTERPAYQNRYRGHAEDVLTAALDAVGVQEGEEA